MLSASPFYRALAGLLAASVVLTMPVISYRTALQNWRQTEGGELSPRAAQQAAAAMLAARSPGQVLRIAGSPLEIELFQTYLGVRFATYHRLQADDRDMPLQIREWLAGGDLVFLAENPGLADLPPGSFGAQLAPAGKFPSRLGTITLYRATGAGAAGAHAVAFYRWSAPDAVAIKPDLEQLSNALAGPALVFPPHFASAIAQSADHPVMGLALDRWPATPAEADRLLALHIPADEPELFEVILIDEARTDPDRAVLLALQARAYRVEESWSGLGHRIRCLGGDVPLTAQSARFEDAIGLVGSGLDTHALPGGFIRLRLAWQTDTAIRDSFKVFVHVTGPDGVPVAQWDSIPGSGLLPTVGWIPGKVVEDRLAIRLPSDLTIGRYQVRVGIYNPSSGLRLRVTSGSPAGDYTLVGRVEVAEADR